MQKSIPLSPGASGRISFLVSPSAANRYSASVDGLTGTFTASTTPAMSIGIITDTDIKSDPSFKYCWMTLDAIVRNNGDGGGDWSVKWYINGALYHSESGYLAAGAHDFASAPPYNPHAYGTYSIDIVFNWNGHSEEYHRQCVVRQY